MIENWFLWLWLDYNEGKTIIAMLSLISSCVRDFRETKISTISLWWNMRNARPDKVLPFRYVKKSVIHLLLLLLFYLCCCIKDLFFLFSFYSSVGICWSNLNRMLRDTQYEMKSEKKNINTSLCQDVHKRCISLTRLLNVYRTWMRRVFSSINLLNELCKFCRVSKNSRQQQTNINLYQDPWKR